MLGGNSAGGKKKENKARKCGEMWRSLMGDAIIQKGEILPPKKRN